MSIVPQAGIHSSDNLKYCKTHEDLHCLGCTEYYCHSDDTGDSEQLPGDVCAFTKQKHQLVGEEGWKELKSYQRTVRADKNIPKFEISEIMEAKFVSKQYQLTEKRNQRYPITNQLKLIQHPSPFYL